MLTPADRSIERLIENFSNIVGQFVGNQEPYALVDFPDHHNVGDSAIYTGEMVFFNKHVQRAPDYVCSMKTYQRDIDRFCPEGPIFIHGGGNFGSVWPEHQQFRHEILDRYPDRQIIQLGQSIHFDENDNAARDETARKIDQHGNFTLLVRDTYSVDFANKYFNCRTELCPDAAHNMWHLPPTGAPKSNIFSVLRADKERTKPEITPFLSSKGPIVDWEPQYWARSMSDRVVEKIIAPKAEGSRLLMKRREKMFLRQAWNRVNYGVDLLSQGEMIVSDRLHVHIMASLMRKPHISLDNMYGKIGRYIAAWGEDHLVNRVDNLEDLEAALSSNSELIQG